MTRIRELRQKKGISQAELAKAVNVVQTAVSKWECGRSYPDMEVAIRLSKFFNVPIDYLLGREEQKKEPATANSDGSSDIGMKLFKLLTSLTPEEADLARAYAQGLIDARK